MRLRRFVLQAALLTGALALSANAAHADPLKVGILIPGSKSDKGWMEVILRWADSRPEEVWRQDPGADDREHQLRRYGSGADQSREQEHARDRRRWPDPGFRLQDRKAVPEGAVLDRRRQRRRERAERRGLRRQAGRNRLCRGGGSGDAVEDRRPQLCRRPRNPLDRQCRQGIRQRREIGQPEHQIHRELYWRFRRRCQVQGSDACRDRARRRHPLPHPQSRPARHGAGGEGEGHAHHRQLHRSLRHRSTLRRLFDHRHRLPGAVRNRRGGQGLVEAGLQGVRPEDGARGLQHGDLRRHAPSRRRNSSRS